MALPFLPPSKIKPIFRELEDIQTGPTLRLFLEYVSKTWIDRNVMSSFVWSVFNMPVGTNNNMDGWHHSLSRQAGGRWPIPFYLLVGLLYREACMINVRLVAEGKLKRIQRKQFRLVQSKVFRL